MYNFIPSITTSLFLLTYPIIILCNNLVIFILHREGFQTMIYHTNSSVALHSFYHIYDTDIRPRLEAIDVFIKTSSTPFDYNSISKLLDVTPSQLLQTMNKYSIIELNRLTFFDLILKLDSHICQLISRQWKYQFLSDYTPQIISEIYNLNLEKVNLAFEELGVTTISPNQLNCIFKRIHITVFS